MFQSFKTRHTTPRRESIAPGRKLYPPSVLQGTSSLVSVNVNIWQVSIKTVIPWSNWHKKEVNLSKREPMKLNKELTHEGHFLTSQPPWTLTIEEDILPDGVSERDWGFPCFHVQTSAKQPHWHVCTLYRQNWFTSWQQHQTKFVQTKTGLIWRISDIAHADANISASAYDKEKFNMSYENLRQAAKLFK